MSLDIIPGKADQKVRLIHDPSIVGTTTGGIKTIWSSHLNSDRRKDRMNAPISDYHYWS